MNESSPGSIWSHVRILLRDSIQYIKKLQPPKPPISLTFINQNNTTRRPAMSMTYLQPWDFKMIGLKVSLFVSGKIIHREFHSLYCA